MRRAARSAALRAQTAALLAALLLAGCSIESDSLLDELEVPLLGDAGGMDEDHRMLEVPPDLDRPEAAGDYRVGKRRVFAARDAGLRVLPADLRPVVRREGGAAWLAVNAPPVAVWPHLLSFWQRRGFDIVEQSAERAYLETNWRERRLDARAAPARVRDQYLAHLERDADALTNVYIANRTAQQGGGGWRIGGDRQAELGMLLGLQAHLLARLPGADAPPPVRARALRLDIVDTAGVPVLVVGQPFSVTWRRLAVALPRAGLNVGRGDRSRGIYRVRAAAGPEGAPAARLEAQFHLLPRGDDTLITAHPARGGRFDYAAAHRLLQRVVGAYDADALPPAARGV